MKNTKAQIDYNFGQALANAILSYNFSVEEMSKIALKAHMTFNMKKNCNPSR